MRTLPTNQLTPTYQNIVTELISDYIVPHNFVFVETDQDFLIGTKKFLAIAENNHAILFNNDSQGKDQKNFDHFQRGNQTMT